MLGWEFPPFISGGLGTACFGLTRGLHSQGAQVSFVLPRDPGRDHATHVELLCATGNVTESAIRRASVTAAKALHDPTFAQMPSRQTRGHAGNVGNDHTTGAQHISAYAAPSGTMRGPSPQPTGDDEFDQANQPIGVLGFGGPSADAEPGHYAGDLMTETRRYAHLCVALARQREFDVIHAHDWMTFPAGLAVAAVTGKPLVVHVHSTEFDRSGESVDQTVYDIERRGMHGACKVICVSHLTRSIVMHRYGVSADKVAVVYNGIENGAETNEKLQPRSGIRRGEKIVLYLGRVTMQKGPEYFIAAAKRVLEKCDNVKFVIAGTGDKISEIIELAAREGIGQKIVFTGFLRGADVDRVFNMADVYVMPSVSEPFGIAPLEAIRHDVPVIISKTSGVAEVLTHALKVDFWDTDEIANKIIAVLRHPPLSSTLREHADMEVRRLTWDGAAEKCLEIYDQAWQGMPR